MRVSFFKKKTKHRAANLAFNDTGIKRIKRHGVMIGMLQRGLVVAAHIVVAEDVHGLVLRRPTRVRAMNALPYRIAYVLGNAR